MKILFLSIFLFFSLISYSEEYSDISDVLPSKISLKEDYTIVVNDEKIFPDVPPVEYEGIVFVPLRFISQALGAEISWIGEKKEVQIKRGERTVIFVVGEKYAKENDKISSLIAPPFIYRGRTMVPLKWTAKSLGAEVKEKKERMEISYKVGILNPSANRDNPPLKVIKTASSKHPEEVGWLRWRNFKVKVVDIFGKELKQQQNRAVAPLFILLWIISVYLYFLPWFKRKTKKSKEDE